MLRPKATNSSEKTRPATAPIVSACSASAAARALVAGAERAADRRGHAAAHGARRQHLHQHDHGEDQGDGGKLGGAEHADVDRLGDRHGGHHQHGREVWQRQPHQRRQYRRVEQRVGGADRGRSRCPAKSDHLGHVGAPFRPGPCRRRAHSPLPATGGGSDSQDRSWQAPRRKDACLSAIICKVTCQYIVDLNDWSVSVTFA